MSLPRLVKRPGRRHPQRQRERRPPEAPPTGTTTASETEAEADTPSIIRPEEIEMTGRITVYEKPT
jgi:hypothetical protein